MKRYLRGWFMFLHAYRGMRKKKHGAGKQPILLALKMGQHYRWIIDGQHRHKPVYYWF